MSPPRPLRLLPVLLLPAFLLPWGLAGCGERRLPLEHWLTRLTDADEVRREEAVREVGRYGRENPAEVLPRLIRMLEDARGGRLALTLRVQLEAGALPSDPDARAQVVSRSARVLSARIRLLGRAAPQMRVDGDRMEVVVVPPAGVGDAEAEERRLVAALSRPGGVELRAEVPPPFTTTPERPVSPFPGDRAAYEAWLKEELRRFEAAGAGGAAYEPADPLLRLAPPSAEEAAYGLGPVPLSAGGSAPFTETDLLIEPRDDPENGTPSLFITTPEPRQAEFREFLARHAGLRLWLVVDGEATLGARLPGVTGSVVAFPVRGPTLAEARTRAARLTALVAVGRYPAPVTVTALPRAPAVGADEAIPRAIVEIGLPAEPALDALVAREASWRPLVDRLKDGILRSQTRPEPLHPPRR